MAEIKLPDKLASNNNWLLVQTLSISLLFIIIHAYRDGSPVSACNTLMPNPSHLHGHGALPSADRSPYSIVVSNLRRQRVNEYAPGGKRILRVRIHGPKYRGYLLQARTMTGSQRRVGQFITPLPAQSKFLTCDVDNPYSAVTHSCFGLKNHQTFYWKPPDDDVGPIVFLASIVGRNRSIYWTLIQSSPLFPTSPTTASDEVEINSDRCGKGFGCVRVGEPQCLSSTAKQMTHSQLNGQRSHIPVCNITLSWICSKTVAIFEILAVRDRSLEGPSGSTYAALILSRSPRLDEAELLVCEFHRHGDSYRATPGAYHYHWKGTVLRPLRDAIAELKASVVDDRYYYCRFSRPLRQHTYFVRPLMTDLEVPLYSYVALGRIYLNGQLQSPATMRPLLTLSNGTSSICSHPDITISSPMFLPVVSAGGVRHLSPLLICLLPFVSYSCLTNK